MKIRLFNLFLYFLFILLTLYFTTPVTAETYPNRISLAISGGASKGAYEAGLIWGLIEVLRRVEKTENWSFGREPRPIEIASIAGTSAGGINTLLAAMVWSVKPENEGGFTNRINDNIFRDVRLTPDVNRLLPPNADPRQYLPDDALLSREDLVEAARELRKKWRQKTTSTDDKSTTRPLMEGSDSKQKEPVCLDGYQLTEAEFADGGLFYNLPIGLGARDVINDADDTFFLTIGIADLPGLAYWLSR
ncbi:MAG: patatin-like phospholipase family protein [Desulfobacteraceae bacterium]|nr:patatin-like phospholipase family protein [Desulfobacteraceae bacterium]MDH3574270.1 patatin-like phospholipase family protein [Desulfobacteraceae bacterium]MDH3836819.1 patatin-like phospholipase family protein [Desulfobacteraceae bacterium]MDH3875690.1 patatin-like phospholipase family protein [Desulfobacteraceae bacterium]